MIIKLKKITEKMGVTKTFIAKQLGVTPQTVGKWIDGIRNPSVEIERRFEEWVKIFKDDAASL